MSPWNQNTNLLENTLKISLPFTQQVKKKHLASCQCIMDVELRNDHQARVPMEVDLDKQNAPRAMFVCDGLWF